MATALALPISIANNIAFPQRDLILFLTFSVILVTTVLQELSIPLIIKWLDLQ